MKFKLFKNLNCFIEIIAGLIKDVLENIDNEKILDKTRSVTKDLCSNFPVYQFL